MAPTSADAALLLMEKLTPNERAAYVLREAFDYSYAEIADVLQSTEPAVRQLVSRARKHMTSERKTPVTAARQKELLASFLAAAQTGGETVAVQKVLSAEATAVCDSAGLMPALTGTFHGAQDVARLVTLIWSVFPQADLTVEAVNGRSGLLIRLAAGEAVAVIAVEAGETGISILWIMLNQDKLSRWHRFPEPC
jgi:RNA polymerase sigma-70 factor (ECF subfamily)